MTSASMKKTGPQAEFRAAGTDISERRRSGLSTGPLMDIVTAPDTIGIDSGATDGGVTSARSRRSPRSLPTPASRAYPGIAACRRARHATNPSSCDARRQPRPALALLVFSQSAYRLPEKGRRRLSGPRAIISTAWRSISAPASRRIPRPWRQRCSRMTQRSSPINEAGSRSGNSWATGRNGRQTTRWAGRDDPRNLASSAAPANARSTSARSAAPMPNGRWSNCAPARDLGRRIPVHPVNGRRRRAGAVASSAPKRRCKTSLRTPRRSQSGRAGKHGRKTIADDRVQARPAVGARQRRARAIGQMTSGSE